VVDPQRLSHRIIAGVVASALVLGFAAVTDDDHTDRPVDGDLVQIADRVDLD
jgi:hypothetical protein